MIASYKQFASARSDSRQMLLVGRFGTDIESGDIDRALRENGARPLRITIRSSGGCFKSAHHIYNRLREFAELNLLSITIVRALSAAAWVALAADHRTVARNGQIMVHNLLLSSIATPHTPTMLRQEAGRLEGMSALLGEIISERTGLSRDEVFKLMEDECELNAARSVELGFAQEIVPDIY